MKNETEFGQNNEHVLQRPGKQVLRCQDVQDYSYERNEN